MYTGFKKYRFPSGSENHLSVNGIKTLCGKTISHKSDLIEDSDSFDICKNCRKSILSKTREK